MLAKMLDATLSKNKGNDYSVVVVGAGQAGLSMSYCLRQQGIDHVVLEKSDSVCPAWKSQRWDEFCLVTPNWQCQLPGFPYRGDDPNGFMVKDEVIAYLQAYYNYFNPPVIFNSSVEEIVKNGDKYYIEASTGSYVADQVVLACGTYHRPRIPGFAKNMPAHIKHIHSSEYKNAEQLPVGEVMVVGTGQSGCQIAEDVHLKGRKVHLCVGSAPRVNRRYRGRDVVNWLDEMGYYHTTIDEHPEGNNAARATNHYVTGRDGGRDINLRIFAKEGMQLYGKLENALDGVAYFADDLTQNLDFADDVAKRIVGAIEEHIQKNNIDVPADNNIKSDYVPVTPSKVDLTDSKINCVVWATGFEMKFDWVKLPVFDELGYPVTQRGVCDEPGIYFLGLNWMHTWGSGRFFHVGRDAEYISAQIVAQLALLSHQK